MKSDRETYYKNYERRFWKTSRRPEVVQNCAPKQVWIWSKLDNSSVLYRRRMERRINFRAEEYTLPRDEKENCAIGWIESDARFGPVSGHKSLQKHTEDRALKVTFHLYSKIKPLLGLELWTGFEKYVQRGNGRSKKKKELRGNPLQKRDQYWNRHQQAIGTFFRWNKESGSTLKWKDPRTLIASRCQNSLLNYFDTRELVEKKMPEFLMIELFEKCKDVSIRGFSRYWSDEIKEKLSMAPYWSAETWIDVLSKGGGTEEKVSILFGKNSCTFEPFKITQEKLILEMLVSILQCKTMYCYQRILPSTCITSETERNCDQ